MHLISCLYIANLLGAKMSNFTVAKFSWASESQNNQIEQIKGLIIFLIACLLVLAVFMRALLKFYAGKNLKTINIDDKFDKLQELLIAIPLTNEQATASTGQRKFDKQYSFDPRICSICPDESDACIHDVAD